MGPAISLAGSARSRGRIGFLFQGCEIDPMLAALIRAAPDAFGVAVQGSATRPAGFGSCIGTGAADCFELRAGATLRLRSGRNTAAGFAESADGSIV